MDGIIRAMYPDCGSDMNKCFERYVRDRVSHMEQFGIRKLKIGTFTNTFDEQFKSVERDYAGRFWWCPHSWNVGTVKDKYVYSFALYLKDSQGIRIQDSIEFIMTECVRNIHRILPVNANVEIPSSLDQQRNNDRPFPDVNPSWKKHDLAMTKDEETKKKIDEEKVEEEQSQESKEEESKNEEKCE